MDDEELKDRSYSLAQRVLAAVGVGDTSVSEEDLEVIGKLVYLFTKEFTCPHKALKCRECEQDTLVHRDEVHSPSFICGACGNY